VLAPGPTSICFSVHSPGQHSVDAVDRLLVMVVAMRWSRQTLGARDNELKGRDAASRVVSGEQEAHSGADDGN
jgi:hypothetical protein